VSESPSSADASRARRPVFEPQPIARPRRPRQLLVGLPLFAIFAAFGAVVWLAYQHGADVPPVGEPPLIKAPTAALKLPPDEAGESTVADQGEVRDLLTDTPPGNQLERLLPSPEEPMTPEVAAQTPTPGHNPGSTPAPSDTAAAHASSTPTPAPTAAVTPPAPTPAPTAQVTPPVQPAPPPAQPASPPAQVAGPPAPATPTPQMAAKPAEPPRQPPVAVERQSAEATPPSATQSPEEAEAALDALLAEVTQSAKSPPASANLPPAGTPARPPVATPAPAPPSVAAVNPAPRPVEAAPQPPPAAVRPSNQQGQVTAIAPDRPGSQPLPAPTLEPAPNGRVAALDGAYRIQLAAVRDEADARRAWELFVIDLGPVLKSVQPFIERADTANGVFYRVQIGPFASLQEAESLCDQLKQRNASCFVIRR
jgi:cell division septation protein DedD